MIYFIHFKGGKVLLGVGFPETSGGGKKKEWTKFLTNCQKMSHETTECG